MEQGFWAEFDQQLKLNWGVRLNIVNNGCSYYSKNVEHTQCG